MKNMKHFSFLARNCWHNLQLFRILEDTVASLLRNAGEMPSDLIRFRPALRRLHVIVRYNKLSAPAENAFSLVWYCTAHTGVKIFVSKVTPHLDTNTCSFNWLLSNINGMSSWHRVVEVREYGENPDKSGKNCQITITCFLNWVWRPDQQILTEN